MLGYIYIYYFFVYACMLACNAETGPKMLPCCSVQVLCLARHAHAWRGVPWTDRPDSNLRRTTNEELRMREIMQEDEIKELREAAGECREMR